MLWAAGSAGDPFFSFFFLRLAPQVTPETGRLHQIRRHLNGISHPIIGDTTHGDRDINR